MTASRYVVLASEHGWLVADLPRKGVKRHGLVMATCATEDLAQKVTTAMQKAWGNAETAVCPHCGTGPLIEWHHLDGTVCVAGWDSETGLCAEGGGPVTPRVPELGGDERG